MQAGRLLRRSFLPSSHHKVRRAILQSSSVSSVHKTYTIPITKMSSNKSTKEEAAMSKVRSFVKPGQGMKETADVFTKEAKNYDDITETLNYGAARKAGELVKSLYGDKTDVKILDVGAGTGLSGQEFLKHGFKNMDALDGSDGMLEVAKEKNIYGQLVCHFVGEDPMPFPDGSYDLVTLVGAMTENHVPAEGLSDIVRVVKSGGYIVNVFRKLALTTPYYKNDLKGFMQRLEDNKVWALVEEGSFPSMIGDLDGFYMVHKVL